MRVLRSSLKATHIPRTRVSAGPPHMGNAQRVIIEDQASTRGSREVDARQVRKLDEFRATEALAWPAQDRFFPPIDAR